MTWYGFSNLPTSPWEALERLRREVDEVFERRGVSGESELRGRVYPPVNLYEETDAYVLTAEIPGVRQEDLQISLEGNRLTLRGERKIEYPEDERTSLHRRERQSGIFRRTLELPAAVEADKVEAVYRHGVLMLRLPKTPEQRPRRIEVTRS